VFDFVEEAFDQMALLANEPIAFVRFGAVGAWRDDGPHAPRPDRLDERVTVIALVADEGFRPFRSQRQQGVGLADVAGLPAGQREVEGVAQGIGDGMGLGAESAPRVPQSLCLGVAARRTRRAGMGAVDGGADEGRLQIREMDAPRVQHLPDAVSAPAGKPLEHGVPKERRHFLRKLLGHPSLQQQQIVATIIAFGGPR